MARYEANGSGANVRGGNPARSSRLKLVGHVVSGVTRRGVACRAAARRARERSNRGGVPVRRFTVQRQWVNGMSVAELQNTTQCAF